MENWQPARLLTEPPHGGSSIPDAPGKLVHVREIPFEEIKVLWNYSKGVSYLESRKMRGCDTEKFYETQEVFESVGGSHLILCEHEFLTD